MFILLRTMFPSLNKDTHAFASDAVPAPVVLTLRFASGSPPRCGASSFPRKVLRPLQGPQVKISANCVISSSRTALHVGALFLRNRHPSNASSLLLSPRGLTTSRGPRSSIRQYAGVLFLVIIRFSLAEKSCGVFAREKWRPRERRATTDRLSVTALFFEYAIGIGLFGRMLFTGRRIPGR